ncbi:MAG: thioredoxin-disulfide reductase [Rickettsiales bacterium]|jgi:thioredoxin reductase (NADPH)|nr:thioredoxin-disulfide reductase [Rickettsiales bacterium]
MQEYKTKNLIIGSGPAGYTAAIYSARANLKPIIVAGMQPGGQLTITTDVENFPGFKDVIQGPWLMEQMEGQARSVGAEIIFDFITEVDFSERPFKAKDSSGNTYIADTIIISTGAEAKWLGMESEEFFKGYGVSGCATCDGFFFKDSDIFVVGGGNTAVEDALYLTNFAKTVTIIHRRDEFRAEKILQDRIFANPKIKIMWDSVLEEIIGDKDPKNVTSIKVKNIKTNEVSEHKTSGVFIAIGHKPNTSLFKDVIKMDDENYIITAPDSTATNIKGIFAAGDVQDKTYRQAVTAAGTGCMAALESEKSLNH